MKSYEGTGYEIIGDKWFIHKFIIFYNFMMNGNYIYNVSNESIHMDGMGGDLEDIVKVISDKKLSLIVSYDFIGEYLPETEDKEEGWESVVVTEVYEKGVKVSEDYEVVDDR
jgi:hypothetical protein